MVALIRALGVILVSAAVIFMVQAAHGADCGDGVGPCSCGDRVVTDTVLDLSDPVLAATCPCDGLIVASGVALDIGGTVRGGGVCVGIRIEDDATNVRIQHGRVTGFTIGVLGGTSGAPEGGLRDVTVSGIQALHNADIGILLEGRDIVVEHNVVRGNFQGILLAGDGIARWNRAEGNGHGIFFSTPPPFGPGTPATALVSNNVAIRNSARGLELIGDSGGGFTVRQNLADLNGDVGFVIGGENVDVIRNVSTRNGRNEFAENRDGFLLECTACRLDRNRSSYNGGFGILDLSTFKETNVYTDNLCGGNALGDSDPPGLCH